MRAPEEGRGPTVFARDVSHRLEADHFASCIRNNTEPKTPGEEGLKDLLAIEAIYRAAGTPLG